MSGSHSDSENLLVGSFAALAEGLILQPTLYWKNASIQRMPFSMNPRIIYRGTTASILNEVQMMSVQFTATGYLQRLLLGDSPGKLSKPQQIMMATAGGSFSALFNSPIELLMIQQQNTGGTLFSTFRRVVSTHGFLFSGMYRGLLPCVFRDGLYVTGLLGVTPVAQQYLIAEHGMGQTQASMIASLVGGVVAALPSHPLDMIKTCLQGDLTQSKYKNSLDTVKKVWLEGGIKRFYAGNFWRSFNIIGTVFIAQSCQNLYNDYGVEERRRQAVAEVPPPLLRRASSLVALAPPSLVSLGVAPPPLLPTDL